MSHTPDELENGPCTESRLLALHTAIVCLARTLTESGQLNRQAFHKQLDQGLAWVSQHDHEPGHNAEAFSALLPMLKGL